MGKLICNNATINYRQVGTGSDVVLIHGLAANHAFWHLDVLLPLTKLYRVTVYDLRGHGYSEITPSGYTTRNMAEDLYQLMDQLDIEKASLIAHSFGGGVALDFVNNHPERVNKVVIADTRVHSIQPTSYPKDWPNAEIALPKLRELGLHIPDDEPDSGVWLLEKLATPEWREARHKLIGSPLFMPFGPWGGGVRSADKWLKLLETTNARKEMTAPHGPSQEQVLSIRQPLLAYYGSRSTLLKSFGGLKKYVPNCHTAIMPDAGHFFPLSQPKIFGQEVLKFISRLEHTQTENRFAVRAAKPTRLKDVV